MKVQWEEADIRPGRIVGKADRTERWMIGYATWVEAGDKHRWCLISTSDGMTNGPQSADLLATYLNSTGEMPAELLG